MVSAISIMKKLKNKLLIGIFFCYIFSSCMILKPTQGKKSYLNIPYASGWVNASESYVEGKVLSKTGEPLRDVQVEVLAKKNIFIKVTDIKGKYSIPLYSGIISLKFSKYGFKEKKVKNILISLGQIVELNVELKEKGISPRE